MNRREISSDLMKSQSKMSPFDPRYVFGPSLVPERSMTPEQAQEYGEVMRYINDAGADALTEHFGGRFSNANEQMAVFNDARHRAFPEALALHWERWEKLYGVEHLPEDIRQSKDSASRVEPVRRSRGNRDNEMER